MLTTAPGSIFSLPNLQTLLESSFLFPLLTHDPSFFFPTQISSFKLPVLLGRCVSNLCLIHRQGSLQPGVRKCEIDHFSIFSFEVFIYFFSLRSTFSRLLVFLPCNCCLLCHLEPELCTGKLGCVSLWLWILHPPCSEMPSQ